MTLSRLLAAAAAAPLLAGCLATTGNSRSDGVTNYPTKAPEQRTANAYADANGVLRNQDGSVVPVYGDPCSELKRTQAATRPSNAGQRVPGQVAGQVVGAIRGGKDIGDKVGGAIAGGAAAIGIQIFGDKVNQAINEPRLATLDGQCAQATAFKQYETARKQFETAVQRCVMTVSRNTPKGSQVDLGAADLYCRDSTPKPAILVPAR